MATDHVVIIGGGVIGAACAHALAMRGQRVTVLESASIAGACSWGNSGFVAPGHGPLCQPGLFPKAMASMVDPEAPFHIAPPGSEAMLDWLLRFRDACQKEHCERAEHVLGLLGQSMMERYKRVLHDEAIECDWRPVGSDMACYSERTLEEAHAEAARYRAQGFPATELDAKAMREHQPALREGALGGVHLGVGASLHPYRFTTGLMQAAAKRGADIHESAHVSGVLTRAGRISGVALGEGRRIGADAVVVCAGMATPALLKPLDIPLPMQAAKGYHVDVSQPRLPVPRCVVIEDADVILTPMDDFVRISGTVEISEDDSLRERRTNAMLRRGLAYAPGIEGRDIASRWMGHRPCAPDGLPIIGPAPNVEGLFVATAHARLGLSLSLITGSIIADFVVDGKSADWIEDLRVDRF